LRGPQTRLAKIDRNYFSSHTIDLKTANQGDNSFWLYEEDFGLPFGVYITQIFPQVVRVQLEEKQTRNIKVKPRLVDELPPGIELGTVVVKPSEVAFESFDKALKKIDVFFTEPISLSGRMKDFEGVYFIDKGTAQGRLFTDKVKVEVSLIEKTITETVGAVPLAFTADLKGAIIEPETVKLTVQGPLSKVLQFVKNLPTLVVNSAALQRALADKKPTAIPIDVPTIQDLTLTVEPETAFLRFPNMKAQGSKKQEQP
jgi:YbbR domain-containing protein